MTRPSSPSTPPRRPATSRASGSAPVVRSRCSPTPNQAARQQGCFGDLSLGSVLAAPSPASAGVLRNHTGARTAPGPTSRVSGSAPDTQSATMRCPIGRGAPPWAIVHDDTRISTPRQRGLTTSAHDASRTITTSQRGCCIPNLSTDNRHFSSESSADSHLLSHVDLSKHSESGPVRIPLPDISLRSLAGNSVRLSRTTP